MRLIIDAVRPEALWLALRMVQAVLRGIPNALACSSSVRNPADSTASASSLILDDWRAFIVALTGKGRSPRSRTWAVVRRRKRPDEFGSMTHAPLDTTQKEA